MARRHSESFRNVPIDAASAYIYSSGEEEREFPCVARACLIIIVFGQKAARQVVGELSQQVKRVTVPESVETTCVQY